MREGQALHMTLATGRLGISMMGFTHSMSWTMRRSLPPMSMREATVALPAFPSKTSLAGSFSFMPIPR